jgi:S-formylglutathione hydrolase FrmB
MHHEIFSAFVDIAGDLGPNTGTNEQTIARLFGGRSDAWADFDPATVIGRHQQYAALSGYFAFVVSNHTVAAKPLSRAHRNVSHSRLPAPASTQ